MALKSIQLATISPSNRAKGQFIVTVHSDDANLHADFDCSSEHGWSHADSYEDSRGWAQYHADQIIGRNV